MIISKVLRTNLIRYHREDSASADLRVLSPLLSGKIKRFFHFFFMESDGNYGNVAIKREQRLLADYAEQEQRKDCEAGLIMGV